MPREFYQYVFQPTVSLDDVQSTIHLALLSTQSLHGESETRLNAKFTIDHDQHACAIESDSAVGVDLNKLFVGYLTAELGNEVFTVQHVHPQMAAPLAA